MDKLKQKSAEASKQLATLEAKYDDVCIVTYLRVLLKPFDSCSWIATISTAMQSRSK